MSSFTQVFGGSTIFPSQTSYLALALSANTTLEWPLDAATGETLVASTIDITTSGSYTITMPDATEASTGTAILFNNLGPDDVDIVDSAAGALLTLSAGEAWLLYLTDNSTAAGSWESFQMGASTAQAQASALAGAGLVAVSSMLAQSIPTSTINSGPYTFVSSERAQGFIWTGAAGTFNLPSVATVGANWFILVRNGGTGELTIDPAGSETINGDTTISMSPGDSAILVTDGNEWWTIGLGQQSIFAFDYTSISVAGLSGTYTLSGSELNRIAYNFTGALAGNLIILVPDTVQQYWVQNSTSGGYTLSLRTVSGSTPVNVAASSKSIYYSNASEVVLAVTTSGIATPIAVVDGGTGATSAASARSNLSAAASGTNSDITSLSGLAAGTVSGPSIAPSGDTNTGHFWPGADQIGGAVGGTRAYFAGVSGSNYNTSFGAGALASPSSDTGNNTAFGRASLTGVTSGTSNTACGDGAGFSVTTGASNTFLGTSAGVGLTTGSNNTLVGNGATATSASVSNQITLGNSSVSALRCQVTSITSLSDGRDKNNIFPLSGSSEFIRALNPVAFVWNMRDGAKVGEPGIGFIAQELQEAQSSTGHHVPGLVYADNPDRMEAAYGNLIPDIINCLQDIMYRLDMLEARLG